MMNFSRPTKDQPAQTSNTVHDTIARVTKWLTGIVLALGGTAVIVLLLLVFVDVIMRNVFNKPIPGVTEISAYWLMVPIVFIGIWWAEMVRDNIAVTLVTDRLGEKAFKLTAVLISVVLVAFLLLLANLSFQEGLVRMAQGEYAGVYRVPIWPMRMLVAFGLVAYAAVVVTRTVAMAFGQKSSLPVSEPDEMSVNA